MSENQKIAIIGGSGDLGSGLARCWARAGRSVIIGSRTAEKAQAAAADLGSGVTGLSNREAAQSAAIVVIAVPFSSHESTLTELQDVLGGKLVIDAVVPLVPPRVATVQLPAEGSAAQIAKRLLPPTARLVSAFHNVGASKLHQGEKADCDVLVFSDDADARQQVIELASLVAVRALDGGVLANSAAAEALTSVLIGINRKYKVAGAGIRITGLDALLCGSQRA